MEANRPERIRVTLRTTWQSGERFTLTLDGPRTQWPPEELIVLARRAGEAAGIIAEPVVALEIALRYPYEVGAAVYLGPGDRV